jgi:natural product precursor
MKTNSKKISLKRETLKALNEKQLGVVAGGGTTVAGGVCHQITVGCTSGTSG